LWFFMLGNPYTFSGLSKTKRNALCIFRTMLIRCMTSESRLIDHSVPSALFARATVLGDTRRMAQACLTVAFHFSRTRRATFKPVAHLFLLSAGSLSVVCMTVSFFVCRSYFSIFTSTDKFCSESSIVKQG